MSWCYLVVHVQYTKTRGTLCAGDSSLSSQLDLAHAQVCCTSHICTRYCATVINGAVHSKYTEEKSADSFCEPDSEKKIVSVKVLVLGYCKGTSRKYETDTLIFCGYRL